MSDADEPPKLPNPPYSEKWIGGEYRLTWKYRVDSRAKTWILRTIFAGLTGWAIVGMVRATDAVMQCVLAVGAALLLFLFVTLFRGPSASSRGRVTIGREWTKVVYMFLRRKPITVRTEEVVAFVHKNHGDGYTTDHIRTTRTEYGILLEGCGIDGKVSSYQSTIDVVSRLNYALDQVRSTATPSEAVNERETGVWGIY